MHQYVKSSKLTELAGGRWLDIFYRVSPALRDAVNLLADNKPNQHVPCPAHGGTNGFRLFKDADVSGAGICNTCGIKSGIALIAWAEDIDYLEAKDMVADQLGLLPEGDAVPKMPKERIIKAKPIPVVDPKKVRDYMNKLWAEGVGVKHPSADPMRLHLANRSLSSRVVNPEIFRFHPNLPYYENRKLIGKYPAMLALVKNRYGVNVSIHRTYLSNEGSKADVECSSKMCAYDESRHNLSGCAIQLTRPGKVLSVGEGLETAWSVLLATKMPTWSATTASLLAGLELPDETQEVWIWADKDRSRAGEDAAKKLCQKLWALGIKARILLPPGDIPVGKKSLDWNDILRLYGVDGFPKVDPSVKLRAA